MHSLRFAAFALLVLPSCVRAVGDPPVEAQDLDGVTVFTYAKSPMHTMQALTSGEVRVDDDGCLRLDDTVVVWFEDQLDDVDDALARTDAGEVVVLRIGGGGESLDEGAIVSDFPTEVRDLCSATSLWWASPEDVMFAETE